MTFRRVIADDVPHITAFLQERAEYVMFPLNNLTQFGLDGDDPLAPRIWRNADGPLTDLLCVTKAGMVMPYLPSGDIKAAAAVLKGRDVIGIIGPATAAHGLRSALGLSQAAMAIEADEGHFKLDLEGLIIPEGGTYLVPASEDLRPTLTNWLIDYHINVLGMDAQEAADGVPHRITRELKEERRAVLMQNDTPVATTAFNAAMPQIVQIGGVYTPPAGRGQGHARRAVALHLDQVRAAGVTTATLFASHPSAIAAYEATGFHRIGDWLMAILKTPQMVQGETT